MSHAGRYTTKKVQLYGPSLGAQGGCQDYSAVIELRGVSLVDDEYLAGLVSTLMRIEKWHGEFPPSGHFVEGENGVPVELSYESAFGSNGARDYMRTLARAALKGLAEKEPL